MWPDRRIIELFKTEFPIVLAPMAGVMDAELVIAAAQGGALGSLPCAMLSAGKGARTGQHRPPARLGAHQSEFLLPQAGRSGPRARGRMEAAARALSSRNRDSIRTRRSMPPIARHSMQEMCAAGRGAEAGSRELPFRIAGQALLKRVKAAGCTSSHPQQR